MTARATFKLLQLMRDGALRSMNELVEDLGISRMTVKRAVEEGKLHQYTKHLFVSSEAEFVSGMSLAAISKHIDGIVCMGSAAQFHELGDEDPPEIWFAVDRAKYGRSGSKAITDPHKLLFWQGDALTVGIGTHTIAGVVVKITSPARTVVDLLRLRKSIGEDVGPKALLDYLKSGRPMADLWDVSKALGVQEDLVPFFRVAEEFREGIAPASR